VSKNLRNVVVAGAAAVIAACGAWAAGRSTSGAQSSLGRGAPQAGPMQTVGDTVAAKVEKAALARYPGTVERVMALPDGSYLAHVFTSSGEVHVAVSKDFEVTGTVQGFRPPRRQGAPRQGPPPAGTRQT
jgi:hypothetical protein